MTDKRAESLPWDDLQVFLAVAQRGSIARAAAYLGVNHSTVLRRLGALEGSLGARLFDRLRDGYALTSTGNELAHRLRGLQEQVDGAHRHALGVEDEIQGAIRLASSDVVVESLLMPALVVFRRRYTGVRVELVTSYAFASLSSDEADIAVRGADTASDHLVGKHVGDIETVPCASHDYLRGIAGDRPWSEHRWVAMDETLQFAPMGKWFDEHVPPAQIVARVDSIVGVADAVAAGLGVGFVPLPLARGRRGLVVLAAPVARMRKPIWVLMHPDVRHVARMQVLFEHLVDSLARSPGLKRRSPSR